LSIWQQNLNKSLNAQLDLLNSLDPRKYDIVAVQEPWLDKLGRMRASGKWEVVYPTRHTDKPGKIRSILFISKNISTDSWTDIDTGMQGISAIHLRHDNGDIDIFNVYNDCSHSQAL
ncbi:hypothetical protein K439DRAFT_1301786, partial [Ramaria rubella]